VPPFGQVDLTVEALVYGLLLGARVVAVVFACALLTAAVDPDEVLRLSRRVSFRSALTAALAVRLVPVLARDGRRLAQAAHCRAKPAGRPAVLRAVATSALDRAVDVAATLEVRGYASPAPGRGRARGGGPPWSRHDLAFAASGGGAAGARRRRDDRRRRGVQRLPAAAGRGGPGGDRAVPRHRARRAPALRRPPGDRAIAALLAFEGVTYAYPDAPRQRLRDVDLVVEPGEFVVVAGPSAGGKSTLLRAACGLVPHFHGGTFAGRVTAGGLDTREHGPGAVAAVAGSLFQDPETQVVLGTVRAELAFGLENRGAPPGAVARGVEEVALALASRPCSTARRPSCPAASCSASPSGRRWRGARRCCSSTSRLRSWIPWPATS
jgi:ABC-type multidrug transport system fused ATPase/permease subunit